MRCHHFNCAFAAALLLCASSSRDALAVTSFQNGDFITYWQNSWGESPNGSNAGQLLQSNFFAVYPSGSIAFGLAADSMTFAGPTPVIAYLPASGTAGPLTGFNDNPTSTISGSFGGDVVALRLNVDYADAGVLDGTSPTLFGDLTLHDFPTLPLLEGMSVREFLANANSLLGRGTGIYDIPTLVPVLDALNFSFQDGEVDTFAQDHLRIAEDDDGSPTGVPEPAAAGLALLSVLGLGLKLTRRCRQA